MSYEIYEKGDFKCTRSCTHVITRYTAWMYFRSVNEMVISWYTSRMCFWGVNDVVMFLDTFSIHLEKVFLRCKWYGYVSWYHENVFLRCKYYDYVFRYTAKMCFSGINVDLRARMGRKSQLCILIYANMIKLGYRFREDFYKFMFMIQENIYEFSLLLVILFMW